MTNIAVSGAPEALTERPTLAQPEGKTLQDFAAWCGWGNNMTDDEIYNAVVNREILLRHAQSLLETHKSFAKTAIEAITERVEALKSAPSDSRAVSPVRRQDSDPWWCQDWEYHEDHVIHASASVSRAVSGEPKWQPIETAPKDGRHVLLYFPEIGVWEVFWSTAIFEDGFWCVSDNKDEDRPLRGWVVQPTHWMPLPASPSAAVSKE